MAPPLFHPSVLPGFADSSAWVYQGQVLVRGDSSLTINGGWNNTLGPAATVACEVMDLPANVTFTVTLETKDFDETDSAASSVGTIAFTTSGAQVKSSRVTGLKQQLRATYQLAGTASPGRVLFRTLGASYETDAGGAFAALDETSLGELVLGSATVAYSSDWGPSIGNAATMFFDVLAIGVNTTLSIDVQTKNYGDADPTTALASFDSITSTGVKSVDASGFKQLWRYKASVTGTGSFRFGIYNVPQPSWQAN